MESPKTICRWCTYWFAIMLCLNTFISKAYSQQQTLTLNEAVANTLEHNPLLFRFTYIEQGLLEQRKNSELSPALSVEVEVENISNTGMDDFTDGSELTLALSSTIELGGTRKARMAIADANMSLAQFEQQSQTLDVLGAVTTAFIEGMATQNLLVVAHEQIAIAKTVLASINKRAQSGAASESEVMRARATLTEAEIHFDALAEVFQRRKITLASYWGETNPDFARLQGSLNTFSKQNSFENLYKRAIDSPAIQAFASQTRLKEAELKLALAKNRSDINWRVGIQHFEETGESAFTGALSVPLFSKRRNTGNIKSILADRKAMDYQQQDALIQLHTQLYHAYSLYQQNVNAVKRIDTELLPTLEKALDLTRDAYERGRDRSQDLFSAQQTLLQAKQSRIETAKIALISQVLIEQLTGQSLGKL